MCDSKIDPEVDLLQKRIIYLDGEVNTSMAVKFAKAMVWLNCQDPVRPITLYIDSPGGQLPAGLNMYDMIKHSSAPVVGIVCRRASSMAAIILQGCTTRQIMPNAHILIHSLRMADTPLVDIEDDFEKILAGARKDQATLDNIVQKRTGLSMEKIREINKKDERLCAQEALELGLVDEILDEK